MTTPAPPLVLRDVHKSFDDVRAVDGVSLELEPTELLALVGPSGCGKSTLLRSVAGLHAIDSGTISLGGELVDDGSVRLPPERRSTGLVFQEHALFPHLTVHDNVGFGVRGASRSDVSARVSEMLELVSLGDHHDRFPHELSGGERQRVALARALAPRPALMLFDEPFASLDHNLRVTLRHDVVTALVSTNTPAIFVTHDQDEALAIGVRVALMRHGKIRQHGTPAEIFHHPADDFVGSFMGDASFLAVESTATGAQSVLGRLELAGHETTDVRAMVRPDDIAFAESTNGPDEIIHREYHGSGWIITARLRDGSVVLANRSHLHTPIVGQRGTVELVEGHRQIAVNRSDDEPSD